jgi:hypothetical protein
MQDREDEAAAGTQRGADGGNRGVEVVDIGQAEITGRNVEIVVAEDSRRGNISVEIAQAQRLILLVLPGLPDQLAGDIDAHRQRPAPRQLAGNTAMAAGDVQDAQASDRAQQIQQALGCRVAGGIEPAGIEVRHVVVPGLGHAIHGRSRWL